MNVNGVVRTLARSFSATARKDAIVKAPVQVFGIDGKYATALYSAAVKEKQLDAVEKDLRTFEISLAKDKIMREFVLNPTIKKSIKVQALESVAKKLSLSTVSTNFLSLLAENNRLKQYKGILSAFNTIMAGHRGDLICEVTSAKDLDDATRKELEPALKKFAKKGENIITKFKVDPTILGGLIVSIGDKYVDMSIASKVKQYSDLLKSAV